MSSVQSYRLFNVVLARKTVLSPSLLSCVFRGEEIRQMKLDAPDQRIKILLPAPNGTLPSLVADDHWWEQIKSLPEEKRPLLRTYTLRRVDADAAEMEVEFVMHGTAGPASAWALSAQSGDALQIVAPNRQHPGDSGGYEWKPATQVEQALIIADETALPAVKGILAALAMRTSPPQLQVFLEVPQQGDCIDLDHYRFAKIYWLPRDRVGAGYGEALLQAVRQHVRLPDYALTACQQVQEEADGELLWDEASGRDNRFYGWVAAESTAVKHLRRFLVGERNLSRDVISFMAYWCHGRC